MTNGKKLRIQASVPYKRDEHRAGGEIIGGALDRIGDGFATRSDSMRLSIHSNLDDRALSIELAEPIAFDLMATLALQEADDTEDVTNFTLRLALRDELADAFEKAAAKLRQAPRR